MRFISLRKSSRQNKKYVIRFDPNLTIHFGSKNSSTFLDHHDEKLRENYLKRHVNEDWSRVNAGSLSRWILWGPTTDLETNLTLFLERFGIE
jgi:hypothetical protein